MRLLVLGTGGKLARLLRASWPKHPALAPVWQPADPRIDLRENSQALRQLISSSHVILNLAGVTRETDTRRFSDNHEIAKAVLIAADGRPVFLCSSAAVYGDTDKLCSEDQATAPLTEYGRSKVAMEQVAASFPNATCLRISNVAGADALLGHDRAHYQLDRFEDGKFPSRSYIGPHHLAMILDRLASLAASGVNLPACLNVAADHPITMDKLLTEANKTWSPVSAPAHAIQQVHLDNSKLANLIETKSLYPSIIEDLRAIER